MMAKHSTKTKNSALVLRLDQIKPGDERWVGGKAHNLAMLLRFGLCVPAGFCVTTLGFDLFLEGTPRAAEIEALLESNLVANPEACARQLTSMLRGVGVPKEVKESVRSILRETGEEGAFAVRSSATVEDSAEGSFAGQFDSSLNVQGEEALFEAVKSCWLSLYSERAVAYFARRGTRLKDAAMAVVVQRMVPAEISGVAFTANPITGAPDQVVIEWVEGLGDELARGRARPERLAIEKKTRRVLGTGGGPAIPEPLRASLLDSIFACEAHFQKPQDIEWAAWNGQVFILQARPITGKLPVRTGEDRRVWVNANTGEILPDVVTPMTWSALLPFFNVLIHGVFRLHGADSRKAPFVGLVAGRVYINLNSVMAALKPFWFIHKYLPNLARTLGGGYIEALEQGRLDPPEEDLPDLGFRWPRFILSWPRIAWDLIRHSPRRGDAWTVRLRSQMDGLARINVEAMETGELHRLLCRVLRDGFEGWDLTYLVTQGAALPIFQKACGDWLGDPELALGYRLFAGLGGVAEAEAGLALWRLAELAHADIQTQSALVSGGCWREALPKLQRTAHGRLFLDAWNEFMREHGHHCRGELELLNPRWDESPDYILGLVKSYIESIGKVNLIEKQERLSTERRQLEQECRRRLRNPLKRFVFTRALRRAQKLTINREEWKNQAVRQVAFLRRVLLALGGRLSRRGILDSREDIFFLEAAEIERVVSDNAGLDHRQRIHQRREEYEKNRALRPPPVVFGKFTAETAPASLAAADANILIGIPVSPGVVSGRARVILRSDDHQQVLPGEILVAPFTDPAWTPYFVTAAAVVVDQGGILSHGSIVAREYGLPAVTNLGAATSLIRTGDLIHVDGTRGKVTILEQQR